MLQATDRSAVNGATMTEHADLKRASKNPDHRILVDIVFVMRLLIQLVFLVLTPQAFSAAFSGVRSITASVAGGLPIDFLGFTALLVVLCIYTIVFGRFFCGFACAFGTFGDVLYYLASAFLRLFRRPRRMMSEVTEAKLRWVKYGVLFIMLLASVCGASSLITAISPWTAFGRLINLQPMQMGILGSVVLGLMCILMMVKERAFCEFLCPLGAIFALLPQLPHSRMRRDFEKCNGCATCQHTCPVSIYPPDDTKHMGECIQCERCTHVCPQNCVSAGGKQVSGGVRLSRMLALAVLLLVLLWLCSSVNFLPSAQDILFPVEQA